MILEVDENKKSYDGNDSKCSSSTLPSLDSSPNDDDKNIKDEEIQYDPSNINGFVADEERVHNDNEREYEKQQGLLNDEDKSNCSVLLDVDRINIDKIGRDLKEEQGDSNNEVKHESNDVIALVVDGVDDKMRDNNENNEKLEQTNSSGNEIINQINVFIYLKSRSLFSK